MNWLRFYFRWNGRIDRAGFLGGHFVVGGVGSIPLILAIMVLMQTGGGFTSDSHFYAFHFVSQIPALIASASLVARRLHDLGLSAKWTAVYALDTIAINLLVIIWPDVINTWVPAVLIVPASAAMLWLLAAPGQRSANKYGTPEQASVSPMAKQ